MEGVFAAVRQKLLLNELNSRIDVSVQKFYNKPADNGGEFNVACHKNKSMIISIQQKESPEGARP
jgi:hypothetical protein